MGQIEVWLEGKKLRGRYALINSELGGKSRIGCWSRRRMRAPTRGDTRAAQPRSVITNRTLARISREKR